MLLFINTLLFEYSSASCTPDRDPPNRFVSVGAIYFSYCDEPLWLHCPKSGPNGRLLTFVFWHAGASLGIHLIVPKPYVFKPLKSGTPN